MQSTVSHTDSTPNASTKYSETPSLTPATSNADTASLSTDATPKQESVHQSSDRPRRARTSVGTYNECILSGSVKRKPRRKTTDGADPTLSGETIVEPSTSAQDQLLQESEEALNRDWKLGLLPGEGLNLPVKGEEGVKRRKSTRLDILEKASDLMEKTSSVLGKRGRETVDAGIEKLKALKGDKRASLRPRDPEAPSFEGPMTKRARISEAPVDDPTPSKGVERKTIKQPTKRWLSQGLYVGQNREFDGRLTESKNKAKKDSQRQTNGPERSLLPLPMFAGQRVIEGGRTFRMPFNVFNPLPPGQPRPEEWKKTQKSRDQLSTLDLSSLTKHK